MKSSAQQMIKGNPKYHTAPSKDIDEDESKYHHLQNRVPTLTSNQHMKDDQPYVEIPTMNINKHEYDEEIKQSSVTTYPYIEYAFRMLQDKPIIKRKQEITQYIQTNNDSNHDATKSTKRNFSRNLQAHLKCNDDLIDEIHELHKYMHQYSVYNETREKLYANEDNNVRLNL